jgi:hypothetical protein
MWRVIVRISFFRDHGSRLRNHLVPMFTAVDLPQAAAQMTAILNTLANPQSVPGVVPQTALNHLWVYIDRV